jgi:sugar lactone lactonase YvrE
MAVEFVASGGKGLTGLAVDGRGDLYVAGSADGRIYKVSFEANTLVEQLNSGGSPTGLAFDHEGKLHILDAALKAVLQASTHDGTYRELISDFNDVPLKGPHSATFSADGSLFFTDPGAPGETSIINPKGSAFFAAAAPIEGSAAGGSSGRGKIYALAQSALAHPTGIALDPAEKAIYVCEASANRLLRFTERPAAVWNPTVFYQFSGRLGPSSIVCDHTRSGLLYVARPELPESSEKGIIAVLSAEGALLRELEVPGPEISSLCLSLDARHLYFSETTTNSIYRILL